MSLFEACDRLITLRAENSALKTELMYYKQKDKLNEESVKKPDPTPVEKLAETSSIGKSILFSHLKDNNEKKD